MTTWNKVSGETTIWSRGSVAVGVWDGKDFTLWFELEELKKILSIFAEEYFKKPHI